FRYPIEIYLIVFTAFGVSTLYDSFRNKFLSILSIALICAGNLLFYKNSDFILNLARKFI
ncbi:MAG: hypothetical protein JW788_07330, partial [Candidatus Omnitrophica bacterium]|nr:hypothetical protein [Candidatus Omnitrophota bacterium]